MESMFDADPPRRPITPSKTYGRALGKKRHTAVSAHDPSAGPSVNKSRFYPSSAQSTKSTKPPRPVSPIEPYKSVAYITSPDSDEDALDPELAKPSRLPAAEPTATPNEFARPRASKKAGRPRSTESDDELRLRLRTQDDINAWLAEAYREPHDLVRLRDAGIIQYKMGKFSLAEKTAIRNHLDDFAKMNRLTDDELVSVVMHADARSAYPRFWQDIGLVVPGRPLKYVKQSVERMYDPLARKGPWTKEEDERLISLYNQYPGEWTKIAGFLERQMQDCRDRWRNELRESERMSGAWSKADTDKLVAAVEQVNIGMGHDPHASDIAWDAVITLMDGKRSRTQCRHRWTDWLRQHEKGDSLELVDKLKLVKCMRELGWDDERDISWSVVNETMNCVPVSLRTTWHKIKALIDEEERKRLGLQRFLATVQTLLEDAQADGTYAEPRKRKRKVARVGPVSATVGRGSAPSKNAEAKAKQAKTRTEPATVTEAATSETADEPADAHAAPAPSGTPAPDLPANESKETATPEREGSGAVFGHDFGELIADFAADAGDADDAGPSEAQPISVAQVEATRQTKAARKAARAARRERKEQRKEARARIAAAKAIVDATDAVTVARDSVDEEGGENEEDVAGGSSLTSAGAKRHAESSGADQAERKRRKKAKKAKKARQAADAAV
ncbi:RNA polymerase I enhancer binding protein [Cryptotrichosporon argae]